MPYYGVKVGLVPGVYKTWDECKLNVNGVPGCKFKKFNTEKEAWDFVGVSNDEKTLGFNEDIPYAYVDGSYNKNKNVYGYGVVLHCNGKHYEMKGHGDDPEMAMMRNVAGEISGATAAVAKAIELGLDSLDIYYDYEGVEKWATGEWRTNKKGTKEYADFMKNMMSIIQISFVKVAAHTGVELNEMADKLAKQAVGIA